MSHQHLLPHHHTVVISGPRWLWLSGSYVMMISPMLCLYTLVWKCAVWSYINLESMCMYVYIILYMCGCYCFPFTCPVVFPPHVSLSLCHLPHHHGVPRPPPSCNRKRRYSRPAEVQYTSHLYPHIITPSSTSLTTTTRIRLSVARRYHNLCASCTLSAWWITYHLQRWSITHVPIHASTPPCCHGS